MENAKSIVRLLGWSLKANWQAGRVAFVITSLYSVIDSSVISILNTYLAAKLTASVAGLAVGSLSLQTPIKYAVLIAVVNIVIIVIGKLINQMKISLNYATEIVFAQMIFGAVGKLNQEQIDDEQVQAKIGIAEREFWALRELSNNLVSLISVIFGYFTALIVLSRFSVVIVIALLILTPLLMFISIKKNLYSRKNWEQTASYWRLRYQSRYSLLDTFNFFEYILLGSRERLRDFWESVQRKINKSELKAERKIATLDLVENTTREGVGLASKLWAIVLVSKGALAFDQFLFTIGLIDQAITATWRVSYEFRSLHEGIIAGQAGLELLDLNPLRSNGLHKVPQDVSQGFKVELEKVAFAYPNSQRVLHNASLTILPGEHVAVVGENGAGKSTLLKLILGQYAPQTGQIRLDDVAINDYDLSSVYNYSSVLVQNYSLFNYMTVRENMQIVNPTKLTEAEMLDSLELAGVKQTVLKLPHGLDTRLDPTFDDGVEVSGGQLQRLAIARSFAKKAKLLVLDEPTSAIDAKAEKKIFDTIFERHSAATVIIVSHRFSTVKKADKIVVLQDGTITEQGSHTDLMKLNGHYAELYNIQAKEYLD